MEFPEYGADESQTTTEYQSNSVTWSMKNGALSVG
jgi:hypothetical protein